jgi:hypothetical protein
LTLLLEPRRDAPAPEGGVRVQLAPAFPLDAEVRSVTANGRSLSFRMRREGDVRLAEAALDGLTQRTEIVFAFDEGTEVGWPIDAPAPGARSQGLRVLRARAEPGALRLVLDGRAGATHVLRVRTPRTPVELAGVSVKRVGPGWELAVRFEGEPEQYVRREIAVPLR